MQYVPEGFASEQYGVLVLGTGRVDQIDSFSNMLYSSRTLNLDGSLFSFDGLGLKVDTHSSSWSADGSGTRHSFLRSATPNSTDDEIANLDADESFDIRTWKKDLTITESTLHSVSSTDTTKSGVSNGQLVELSLTRESAHSDASSASISETSVEETRWQNVFETVNARFASKAFEQLTVTDGDSIAWRDHRRSGGCVLEVPSGETVCSQLSMPHSPRWYRDQLWLVNSGTGEFGRVNLASGRFEPIAFFPGYLRGLTFRGDYAIATLSKPRHVSFQGLEIDDRLSQKNAEPQCGLQIIDLRTGAIQEWLRLDGTMVTELYDAVVLPGVRQPMAVGFKNTEIERLMIIED